MDERIAQRIAVLHQMYEIAGGDSDCIIKKVSEIAEPLGLT